jgi:hypothetical protein
MVFMSAAMAGEFVDKTKIMDERITSLGRNPLFKEGST